jgi:F0F1-type ATP synthase assembly protein I
MVSAIGFTLVFCTAIGIGIGHLFDRWLGSDPWGKVIGLLVGTVAGFVEMIRTVSEVSEISEDEDKQRSRSEPRDEH